MVFLASRKQIYFNFNHTPRSTIVFTKNDFKNIIAKNAIMGEISMPNLSEKGKILLIGSSMGSVALYKNCTMGLKGSGLTQLINARIIISQ